MRISSIKTILRPKPLNDFTGDKGIRTPDPRLAKPML